MARLVTKVITTGLLGLGLGFPVHAAAVNVKTIHGSVCVTERNYPPMDRVGIFGYVAPANRDVHCPLVRESTQGYLTFVYVRVGNANGGSITCRAIAVEYGGNQWKSVSETTTIAGDSSINLGLDSWYRWDSDKIEVWCTMGNGDVIYGIKYAEQEAGTL